MTNTKGDSRSAEEPAPCVTLIIPVRNEEGSIGDCLDSITNQTFESMEILVIDGESTDQTISIVRSRMADDVRIRLIKNERRVTTTALNLGLTEACGTFLVRVDGHSVAAPDYVQRVVDHMLTGEYAGVGGTKIAVGGASKMSKVIASVLSSPFGVGGSLYHYAEEVQGVDHIPFGAYRVDDLRSLGGWNAGLIANEDFELDYRIVRSGGRLLLDPQIRVYWKTSQTLRDLSRQYRRYGMGKAGVARLHPTSLKVRHLLPAVVFVTILGTVVAVPLVRSRKSLLVNVPYLLFLLSALTERPLRKSARKSPWMVPLVLFTMEMSWAWGFLRGIWATPLLEGASDAYQWRDLSQAISQAVADSPDAVLQSAHV